MEYVLINKNNITQEKSTSMGFLLKSQFTVERWGSFKSLDTFILYIKSEALPRVEKIAKYNIFHIYIRKQPLETLHSCFILCFHRIGEILKKKDKKENKRCANRDLYRAYRACTFLGGGGGGGGGGSGILASQRPKLGLMSISTLSRSSVNSIY